MKLQHPNPPMRQGAELNNLRPPLVFLIPRMYEDDYPRNAKWYVHLKKIERKAREIRNELVQIKQRRVDIYQKTQEMIAATRERRNSLVQKRSGGNSEFYINHYGQA